MEERIRKAVGSVLEELGLKGAEFSIERPSDLSFGDYSTNAALVCAKEQKTNPQELAQRMAELIAKKAPDEIEKVEAAGAGFVNFFLNKNFFVDSMLEIARLGDDYGRNNLYTGQKIMIEYTDPNPFKEFHIGHLMSNTIGESLARITEFCGAKVIRACWQGDIGLHVAKAVWGMKKNLDSMPAGEDSSLRDKAAFLGNAYVDGAKAYVENENSKKEIDDLNNELFTNRVGELARLYDTGRKWSLDHFEEIYAMVGTKFDHYFFEGKEGLDGIKIVDDNLKKGIFERSDGAVVYRGEKKGLHTRVFITSRGLPTYEAKELGLNKAKFEKEPDMDRSVVITANEQDDYFKVVLSAISEIFPEIGRKTVHVSHGMLRFASGKMSSREGNVITGESLLRAVSNLIFEKVKDRDLPPEEKQTIATAVGVGAIKYSILKQTVGADIIYNFEKSISFEGDSGPYLQYSYSRSLSVIARARDIKLDAVVYEDSSILPRLLYRFPEVVQRAMEENSPHHIATFLIEIASAFNSFYAKERILDAGSATVFRVAMTAAFATVMKNGLRLLGISPLGRM